MHHLAILIIFFNFSRQCWILCSELLLQRITDPTKSKWKKQKNRSHLRGKYSEFTSRLSSRLRIDGRIKQTNRGVHYLEMLNSNRRPLFFVGERYVVIYKEEAVINMKTCKLDRIQNQTNGITATSSIPCFCIRVISHMILL